MSQQNQYYQGPAYFYTPEEKSYTVLQAYKDRVLSSQDIKSFLFKDRLNVWSIWGFPILSYYGFKQTGVLNKYIAYNKSYNFVQSAPLLASAFLWLVWVNFNPFEKKLDNEKEQLLQLIERRIGVSMKGYNDILPRFCTTQELHRQTRQLYNQRNSIFVNILYPSEEAKGPLFDLSSYNWKYKGEKLTK